MIKLQDGDATVNTKVREVKSGTLKGFCIENGMLYHVKTNNKSYDSEFGKRLVIPGALVSTVLTNCHDEASGAHQSERKTWLKISARYYWDHMRRDIRKWCKSCKICAAKKPPALHKPTLHPITHPNKAFDTVGVDSIGPLPITENGNKYILVFTDYATRWVEAFPTKDMEAKTVAKIFFDEIVCRHGAPKELLSDQGRNFLSEIVKETCEFLRN